MKVLITGATGFVGRPLASELLSSGYEVVGLARKKEGLKDLAEKGLETRLGDIRDLSSLLRTVSNVDAVIHLAAATSIDSTDYNRSFLVNVLGSQNVIEACRINGIKKIVHLGTQSDNTGAYATTKREAEKLFQESNLDWVTIRPSLVYGPGSKGLFASITGFLGRFPFIPIVGTGNYHMRPIYVGDVVWAIKKCLETDTPRKEYFISGPNIITYRKFMEEIAKAMGLRRVKVYLPLFVLLPGIRLGSLLLKRFAPVTVDTLRGLINPRIYDNDLAEKDLGFVPIPLQEGLRRTFP